MKGQGRRVAVTGLGVVAPCGLGKEAFWSGLLGPGLQFLLRRLACHFSPGVSRTAVSADQDPQVGAARWRRPGQHDLQDAVLIDGARFLWVNFARQVNSALEGSVDDLHV